MISLCVTRNVLLLVTSLQRTGIQLSTFSQLCLSLFQLNTLKPVTTPPQAYRQCYMSLVMSLTTLFCDLLLLLHVHVHTVRCWTLQGQVEPEVLLCPFLVICESLHTVCPLLDRKSLLLEHICFDLSYSPFIEYRAVWCQLYLVPKW